MPWQAQMKGKETGTQRCAQEQRRDSEERRKTKDASTTRCVPINTASPAHSDTGSALETRKDIFKKYLWS